MMVAGIGCRTGATIDAVMAAIMAALERCSLTRSQIDALATRHRLTREQVIEEIMLKPMPKRQFIGLDELAGTVEFLLSVTARNITGQCITLDGGWTAQ